MDIRHLFIGTVAAVVVAFASPAAAHAQSSDADRPAAAKAQDTAEKSDNKVEDAWILTKVKAKFVGEDALKDSDINVDVRSGVVVLKGTVASEAGRARAIAIAKATDGVARVDDRLVIGMARDRDDDDTVGTAGRTAAAKADDAEDAGERAGAKMKDKAERAGEKADRAADRAEDKADRAADRAEDKADRAYDKSKAKADRAAEKSKEAAGTAGEAITDGWITTKVKSSFVGVDALDGSDIDVDTNDHVVTLTGSVRTSAGRAEAVRIAKSVKGVTRVVDKLTVGERD